MMLYVFNLKQLHWIQPYEDTNLKLMRLQSSMMIIPNQLFLVQQKWMLISLSTVSLSAQEKFPTEIFISIYSEKNLFFYIYLLTWNKFWKTEKDFVRYQQLQQQLKGLETDAENARSSNRELMNSYSKRLKLQSRKLGHMVDQVRPYFEQKKRNLHKDQSIDFVTVVEPISV